MTDCDPRREAERDARQCVEGRFPRFLGDNEADAPLGTGYEAWLDTTARALPRQDDDPKACPF